MVFEYIFKTFLLPQWPMADTFCCCVSLKKGSIITGIFWAIVYLLLFPCCIVLIVSPRLFLTSELLSINDEWLSDSITYQIIGAVYCTVSAILFTFTVFLLIGIYKYIPKYIKYWVQTEFVVVILQVVIITFNIIDWNDIVFYPNAISAPFGIFSLVIVHSYYSELTTSIC